MVLSSLIWMLRNQVEFKWLPTYFWQGFMKTRTPSAMYYIVMSVSSVLMNCVICVVIGSLMKCHFQKYWFGQKSYCILMKPWCNVVTFCPWLKLSLCLYLCVKLILLRCNSCPGLSSGRLSWYTVDWAGGGNTALSCKRLRSVFPTFMKAILVTEISYLFFNPKHSVFAEKCFLVGE